MKKAYFNSSLAQVVQYPLSLAFSITGHKSQGQTIERPGALETDLHKVWSVPEALSYVIYSRIDTLDQLLIIRALSPSSLFIKKQRMK